MTIPAKTAFIPLDEEEAALMDAIEHNEYEALSPQKQKKIISLMSKATIVGPIKTKPISLRLKEPTILKLKHQSRKSGVPYQTILSALADQYADGKIKLGI